MKIDGKVVERPQHLLMRVAVGIHGEDIPAAIETYTCCQKNGLPMPPQRCLMQAHLSLNSRHAFC
jgi:hypothetical protein